MQSWRADQTLPGNDISGEPRRSVDAKACAEVAEARDPHALEHPDGGGARHLLEYVKQRPADLVYWLFEGPAPREAVRVIAERRVKVPDGEAVLAIIGSSHFLELRRGGALVTEMLASARPGLEGLLTARGVQNGRAGIRLVREALDYRFRLEEMNLAPGDFERWSSRLMQEATDRVFYRFPSGEGEASAVTCLDWRLEGHIFSLDTYHTFPGESTIVRSRTLVGFPERGGTP